MNLLPQHVPLVVTTRGRATECVHYGSIAVADAAGRLLYSVGDCEFPIFTRSALKPLQALPFVVGEGPQYFDFPPEQIALLCASHSGETQHTDGVTQMLAKTGVADCAMWQVELPRMMASSHAPTAPRAISPA